eukprot:TRINITY_DN6976_c0_g1_i1.p1 TRINITY_DN6976_c0_g1~~TRINITY_DN6976_c0_g1_i1.p1  ORF type:complete len:352 (-),score=57.79 TRINITY_DN6976_c0_g1_i1:1-984(-)
MVKFAPVNIPLERRLQTAAVCFMVFAMPVCLFLSVVFVFTPATWIMFIPYLFYVFLNDAQDKGGRPSQWFRKSALWRKFRDYFPCELVLTQKLDPKNKYIFGYHPHGILGLGCICNFATDANNISEQLKGIDLRVGTLSINFKIPFFREMLLALNFINIMNVKSCDYILSRGKSLVIVVGGASESLDAKPHEINLIIKKRKGFIKLAIRNGAHLVPVFSFGENELYTQMQVDEKSFLKKIQVKFQSLTGFALPFFNGRGIFNYDFGLLPKRQKIITIVGKPIQVQQNDNPTEKEIQRVQELYINALTELFNNNKEKYGPEDNIFIKS